jgi:hypothetical protein
MAHLLAVPEPGLCLSVANLPGVSWFGCSSSALRCRRRLLQLPQLLQLCLQLLLLLLHLLLLLQQEQLLLSREKAACRGHSRRLLRRHCRGWNLLHLLLLQHLQQLILLLHLQQLMLGRQAAHGGQSVLRRQCGRWDLLLMQLPLMLLLLLLLLLLLKL